MNGELQAIAMKLETHKDVDVKFSLILQAIVSLKLATRMADQDDGAVNSESARHPSSLPIQHTDERRHEDAKLMDCVHRLQAFVY